MDVCGLFVCGFLVVGYEDDGVGTRQYVGSNPLLQSADFGGSGACLVGTLTPAEEGANLAHFSGGGVQRGAGKERGCWRSWCAGRNGSCCEVSCNKGEFGGLSSRCRIRGGGVRIWSCFSTMRWHKNSGWRGCLRRRGDSTINSAGVGRGGGGIGHSTSDTLGWALCYVSVSDQGGESVAVGLAPSEVCARVR